MAWSPRLKHWRFELTDRVIEESIVVHGDTEKIFNLLAIPSNHPIIDGSSSVKATIDAPARLSLGAQFRMDMKIGAKYKVTNHVVEFVEGQSIAWRHFGGHIWRYTMVDNGDGTVLINEQFDYRGAKSPLMLEVMGAPKKNKKAMANTLRNLKHLVEDGKV